MPTINKTSLTTWLFKRPVIFSVVFFITSILTTIFVSAFSAWLNLGDKTSFEIWAGLILVTFLTTAFYTIIKRLPHEDIPQSDFVAITNGCSLITISIPVLTLLITGTNANILKQKLLHLYITQPTLIYILAVLFILLYLYVAGVAISGLYSKYKRATSLGISKWKVITSWPFGFLLSWLPGYVIKGKNIKSNLTIKTKWFTRFNNWTLLNSVNTWFVFLMLLLLSQTIAGIPAIVLSVLLLLYYGLWNLKYKSDFPKILTRGYALSAVVINVIFICLVLIANIG